MYDLVRPLVSLYTLCRQHKYRKRAKVVTAIWGTEFIQFLAALAVLHLVDLKNRINAPG